MKTNLDKAFKSDKKMETEGIWLELSEGVKFRVARFGGGNSSAVKKAMAKYYKPYARAIEKGLLAEEKEREVMAKAFVDSCVLDWEGIEIDGELTPFSKEKAVEFFLSLPDLLDVVVEYASAQESYKEDLGNS